MVVGNSSSSEANLYELLKNLNKESESLVKEFLSNKRTSKALCLKDRSIILERAKKNPDDALRVILNNYGFRTNTRFRTNMVPEIDLPPQLQKLAIINGDYKFQTGNFRDANWVKTGCLGEMAFVFFMNCAFHFFNFDVDLPMINTQSLLYGGDGGNDFRVGNSDLDIKYRDDNPSKGMALQNRFLKSSLRDPDGILLQISNITNDKKLGHSVVNTPIDKICKDLPLALVGYVSIDEYNRRKQPFEGYSDWIVDDLNGVSSLIIRLLDEVNQNEGMFEI